MELSEGYWKTGFYMETVGDMSRPAYGRHYESEDSAENEKSLIETDEALKIEEIDKEFEIKESKELKDDNISGENLLPETKESTVKSRVSTRTEEFMYWYRQSFGMKREKQFKFIASKLQPYFKDEESLYRFVAWKLQLRERADITRRIRCKRRADLHEFSYFCTFTYDSQKMDEKEFERKLLNTLRHFASRKNWKYMGTWERGHDNERLYFHAVMYIPPDKMSGEVITKREFDLKEKRMKDRTLNTFFEERFGRNTFQEIDGAALSVNTALGYILKYIEKDGGRVICSRGLRTFIETDIDDDDIITRLHENDDMLCFKSSKPAVIGNGGVVLADFFLCQGITSYVLPLTVILFPFCTGFPKSQHRKMIFSS